MKKNVLLITLIVLSVSTFAQGISFETDHSFVNALAKAKKENKIVFIDAYTTWCGPCKMMANNIFTQKEVGDYYNTKFVNLKLDMEASENVEIAKKYNVQVFPTFLFISHDGSVVHRGLGSMTVPQFIELGEKAGDAENNVSAIQRKIDAGDRSLETITNYFTVNPHDENNESIAIEYLEKLSPDKYLEKSAWEIFYKYVENPYSVPFQYLLNNRTSIENKFGKKAVDTKIKNVYASVYKKDKTKFESLRSMNPIIFDEMKELLAFEELYIIFSDNKTDKVAWDNFMVGAMTYMNNDKRSVSELSAMAWLVFENYRTFNDKQALKLAAEWVKKGTKEAPEETDVMNTYANILYDLGKKKAAVTLAMKALELAEKRNDSNGIVEYQKTLSRFKK